MSAEETLKQSAITRKDEVMMRKISGEDLIAKEAHYHEECRKGYINISRLLSHDNSKENQEDDERRSAHKEAFSILAEYIETEIIAKSTVVRISILKDKYQCYLKDTYPKFHNAEYPNQKLKDKIQRHFNGRILFFQPKYKSEIVYSEEISTAQAVEIVYDSSSSELKILENSAQLLRGKDSGKTNREQ